MKPSIALLVSAFLIMASHTASGESCDPRLENKTAMPSSEPDKETADAIREITGKLERVLERESLCQDKGAGFATPCFDPVSSQSALSQMCDKIASLETTIYRLTKQVLAIPPLANSNPGHNNPSGGDIDKLKKDVALSRISSLPTASLKRSSAFYASRVNPIPANATRQPVKEYNVTVNTGTGIGFDELNGVYMAPYEGVYHFSLAYKMKPEVDLKAFLVVDNLVLADTSDKEVGQLDVLTSLKIGQQVWTDVTANEVQDEAEVTLTFSGFLID
ncbi:unnamed protein product [Lymnaea stagnalis]|uniref:C1q domain-containing protein n=1 Tax=Lymnaea stagnalis TaxID=6523 RepID=A0AAV2HM31_LYMST